MQRNRYSEQEMIEKTREAIRYFIQKKIEPFVALLDENFVWVGDYESLYMKGIPSFLRSVKDELEQPGVQISDEEYAVLTRERGLWVTYGRFLATSGGQAAKVHFTFVWRQKGDDLRLLHANATHVKKPEAATAQSRIFESDSQEKPQPYQQEEQTLTLRDLQGSIHYLLADHVLYVKSTDKICEVFTTEGSFQSRITLKALTHPPMLQLHKSYLCNLGYLRKIKRYQATLADGTTLPVGRECYMDVKSRLQAGDMASAQDSTPKKR